VKKSILKNRKNYSNITLDKNTFENKLIETSRVTNL
jgi:hypothetical protein